MTVFAVAYLLTFVGIVGAGLDQAQTKGSASLSGPVFGAALLIMLISGVVLAVGEL